ncbi:hypothetical protein ACWGN5_21840 [Streptomyces sp. NPDC055815]
MLILLVNSPVARIRATPGVPFGRPNQSSPDTLVLTPIHRILFGIHAGEQHLEGLTPMRMGTRRRSAATGHDRDPSAGVGRRGTENLHRILMWQLLRFTAPPLSGASDAGLVRGVLLPPERRGINRVVPWDGHRMEGSAAHDVPLIHRQGDNIPWTHLIAAFRQILVHPPSYPTAPTPSAFRAPTSAMYVSTQGTLAPLGIEVDLHDKYGRGRAGNTALMAAELKSDRSPSGSSHSNDMTLVIAACTVAVMYNDCHRSLP